MEDSTEDGISIVALLSQVLSTILHLFLVNDFILWKFLNNIFKLTGSSGSQKDSFSSQESHIAD